jgi:hypothetical protein
VHAEGHRCTRVPSHSSILHTTKLFRNSRFQICCVAPFLWNSCVVSLSRLSLYLFPLLRSLYSPLFSLVLALLPYTTHDVMMQQQRALCDEWWIWECERECEENPGMWPSVTCQSRGILTLDRHKKSSKTKSFRWARRYVMIANMTSDMFFPFWRRSHTC